MDWFFIGLGLWLLVLPLLFRIKVGRMQSGRLYATRIDPAAVEPAYANRSWRVLLRFLPVLGFVVLLSGIFG